jgi:cell division protein FtsQ
MKKALHIGPVQLLRMKKLPGKGGPAGGRAGRQKPGRPRGNAKGATRKVAAAAKARRSPSVWFNRLLILTGAVVVAAAAIEAYFTLESIPVQRITVTGELAHTRYEEVQEMVQPALAGGFLNADLHRIRSQLEALPWIYEATVRRKWPSALEINVMEQLPTFSITRERCFAPTAVNSGNRCPCCGVPRVLPGRWWRTTNAWWSCCGPWD